MTVFGLGLEAKFPLSFLNSTLSFNVDTVWFRYFELEEFGTDFAVGSAALSMPVNFLLPSSGYGKEEIEFGFANEQLYLAPFKDRIFSYHGPKVAYKVEAIPLVKRKCGKRKKGPCLYADLEFVARHSWADIYLEKTNLDGLRQLSVGGRRMESWSSALEVLQV